MDENFPTRIGTSKMYDPKARKAIREKRERDKLAAELARAKQQDIEDERLFQSQNNHSDDDLDFGIHMSHSFYHSDDDFAEAKKRDYEKAEIDFIEDEKKADERWRKFREDMDKEFEAVRLRDEKMSRKFAKITKRLEAQSESDFMKEVREEREERNRIAKQNAEIEKRFGTFKPGTFESALKDKQRNEREKTESSQSKPMKRSKTDTNKSSKETEHAEKVRKAKYFAEIERLFPEPESEEDKLRREVKEYNTLDLQHKIQDYKRAVLKANSEGKTSYSTFEDFLLSYFPENVSRNEHAGWVERYVWGRGNYWFDPRVLSEEWSALFDDTDADSNLPELSSEPPGSNIDGQPTGRTTGRLTRKKLKNNLISRGRSGPRRFRQYEVTPDGQLVEVTPNSTPVRELDGSGSISGEQPVQPGQIVTPSGSQIPRLDEPVQVTPGFSSVDPPPIQYGSDGTIIPVPSMPTVGNPVSIPKAIPKLPGGMPKVPTPANDPRFPGTGRNLGTGQPINGFRPPPGGGRAPPRPPPNFPGGGQALNGNRFRPSFANSIGGAIGKNLLQELVKQFFKTELAVMNAYIHHKEYLRHFQALEAQTTASFRFLQQYHRSYAETKDIDPSTMLMGGEAAFELPSIAPGDEYDFDKEERDPIPLLPSDVLKNHGKGVKGDHSKAYSKTSHSPHDEAMVAFFKYGPAYPSIVKAMKQSWDMIDKLDTSAETKARMHNILKMKNSEMLKKTQANWKEGFNRDAATFDSDKARAEGMKENTIRFMEQSKKAYEKYYKSRKYNWKIKWHNEGTPGFSGKGHEGKAYDFDTGRPFFAVNWDAKSPIEWAEANRGDFKGVFGDGAGYVPDADKHPGRRFDPERDAAESSFMIDFYNEENNNYSNSVEGWDYAQALNAAEDFVGRYQNNLFFTTNFSEAYYADVQNDYENMFNGWEEFNPVSVTPEYGNKDEGFQRFPMKFPPASHTNQKIPHMVWNPDTNQCEYVPRNKRKFIDEQANTVNKRIRTFAAQPGAQKAYF
jgi:hypothetical protein